MCNTLVIKKKVFTPMTIFAQKGMQDIFKICPSVMLVDRPNRNCIITAPLEASKIYLKIIFSGKFITQKTP
jgi:hypothetical protein